MNRYHYLLLLMVGLLFSVTPNLAQDLSDGFQDRERADAVATTNSIAYPGQARGFATPSVASTLNSQRTFGMAASPTVGFGRPAWANMSKEMVESNKKVNDLIKNLHSAEDETEKEDIKADLKVALEDQYDLYLAQHEAPLKELEEKLEKLRKEFEWRKNARDDLVKLRLDTVWFDSQGLGWPTQNPVLQGFPIAPIATPNQAATPFPALQSRPATLQPKRSNRTSDGGKRGR